MLREAHRVHVHHSQREDLSVGQSSSVSERTGRLVGERAGRPAESSSQDAQIRILLDRHEFQADYDRRSLRKLCEIVEELHFLKLKNFNDEINSFFMKSYCSKIWNYVKLIRKVSMK